MTTAPLRMVLRTSFKAARADRAFPLPDAATSHGTPTMELSRGNVAADGTTVTLGPQSFVVFSF